MTKGSQTLGKATTASNNSQTDKQTRLSTPERKSLRTPQARASPTPNAGLHPAQRGAQHHGAGFLPANDEGAEDQAHEEALKSQEVVIRQLQDYGLSDRQLRDLYDGQGLSGMSRFMRDNSGTGFTFYRPPGSAER
ncbi:hypothetical protein Q9L58_009303 [Maublancomyces gigas]|uniref:Uncharacterized protein n=1 Tax=Discina gigas TaxID=1032678 RepID=A0ABR3G785_9PEZI